MMSPLPTACNFPLRGVTLTRRTWRPGAEPPSPTWRRDRRSEMLNYYCPHCWKEIEAGAIQCPHCLYALADHERLSYEEKLLRALGHPIRENRMLAIQLLGELRSTAALPAFEAILRAEEDPYVV